MGEVVISSEDLEMVTESETERNEEMEESVKKKKRRGNKLGMTWEKLLPRMVLRVLLVEADDSTRQIITALLRKCSYKVVAVPDGLKAWEMLKRRPNNIDLILTEVDLPLISGYALLTLIMEHDVCKNIPVIMMSSQDSISTVYKCMLRGAADYLVKPIRRNELRNLWQHVWRRQSSLARGNVPREESVGQDKVEATSENNAASDHASGDRSSLNSRRHCMFPSCLLQSSCIKPDMEAESASTENVRDFLQPAWGSLVNMPIELGSASAACTDPNRMAVDEDAEADSQRKNADITRKSCDGSHFLVKSSREAIDFMGTSASINFSVDNTKRKFDIFPQLDLCLARCHQSGFEIQNAEDRRPLRHSNASAFTPYNNRPLENVHTNWASNSNQKELGAYSERKFSSNISGYNSDAPGPPSSTERPMESLAICPRKESEAAISCAQQRVIPLQISVEGAGCNNICTSNGSTVPPVVSKQSGASTIPSRSSGSQPEPNCEVNPFRLSNFKSNSEHLYDRLVQQENDTSNLRKHDKVLDSFDDQGHISHTADQSATSCFYNSTASHLNMGYGSTSGSNSNIDQVAKVRTAVERINDGFLLHNANSHRSIQREAALNKFRLKRKDRCYEKKVRYESRKKLAEQRPRVKGQFVRQGQPPSAETEQ
ncbi:two-component response regulator-like APRR5 [Mercurialis annua]|uniref:two-component response regulator-like APRR5 n=1 Tax=Mercurialis annua TaxID=3986 RepID=UPI0024AD32B7|nr:two-component response regulator-like APRR5 [Mercurialis annua]